MTREQIDANCKANKPLLKQWLAAHGYDASKRAGWFAGTPISRTFYFARYEPRRVYGNKWAYWRKLASVDLKQPSIFNERGKLRVRLLKS